MKAYYDARAPEYDDWFHGIGRYADRDRPEWDQDLAAVIATIAGLPPARTLDVACGTAFLSRHLRGELTLPRPERAHARNRRRARPARGARRTRTRSPYRSRTGAFERLFTGHFYGHLEGPERAAFLAEARRVADEIVVVDSSLAHSPVEVEWQQRVLNDGSEWEVYKRFFSGPGLAEELGGGEVLHDGRWFVVVRAPA